MSIFAQIFTNLLTNFAKKFWYIKKLLIFVLPEDALKMIYGNFFFKLDKPSRTQFEIVHFQIGCHRKICLSFDSVCHFKSTHVPIGHDR